MRDNEAEGCHQSRGSHCQERCARKKHCSGSGLPGRLLRKVGCGFAGRQQSGLLLGPVIKGPHSKLC